MSRYWGLEILMVLAVLALDTLRGIQAEEPSETAPSDSVQYAAELIDYRFEQDTTIVLQGKAEIKYQGMELEAGRITYYPGKDLICAGGLPDSSTEKPELIGTPIFRDRGEELEGLRMTYNLKTGRGTVIKARTRYEEGFYTGEEIRKVAEKTLRVSQGTYTTCDKNRPHYHFYSRRMKILTDDKVIVKPLIFYVADVPVLWLPFFVFSIRKDRHSGFLTPRYGSNSLDGRYLYNVGYYFAPSDYWDVILRGRLREKTGWMLESKLQYHLRGRFRGSVDGSFDSRATGEGGRKRGWELGFGHIHTLSPTMTLRGSGRFRSDKDFSAKNSINLYDRLNRTLRSHVSLDKRWVRSGNSLNLAISHSKNLDTSETTAYLPQASFRKSRRPIFRAPEGQTGDLKWYHSIYYSLSSNFSNMRREWKSGTQEERDIRGRLNLSGSQKISGWLNLTPSFDLETTWRDQGGKPTRTDTYNGALSANTTLYGLFRPQVGALRAIRHVVKPNVSFAYSRSKQTGVTHSPRDMENLRFHLGNILQVKTEKDGKERKFDLATIDLATSYDFKAEERKLSDLSSTLRVKPSRRFDITLNSEHDFYDADKRFHLSEPNLKRVSVTTSFRVSARGWRRPEPTQSVVSEDLGDEIAGYRSGRVEPLGFAHQGSIPYGLGLSHRYSLIKTGFSPTKIHWIKGDLSFSPTSKWQVDYWLNYDLKEGKITAQQLSIYRDLHCWEAKVIWMPSGYRRGYYFRMNIKALPEIKIEKKRGIVGF